MYDMNSIVGSHDLLLVTLDMLRYDVAVESLARGRTPHIGAVLPDGVWERRTSPASFTYAAHLAFFAGFLPVPADPPGPAAPRLFSAEMPGVGRLSVTDRTWRFGTRDVPSGLAGAGYHTVCVGGVDFFTGRNPLGSHLPSLFAESHWEPSFGNDEPASFEAQLDRVDAVVGRLPAGRRLFLFVNVSATHSPHHHYLSDADEDSPRTQAAALEYVDRHIDRLFTLMGGRGPCFTILCADHGHAYGEDGHKGHRSVGHDTVWTVPYAEFVLAPVRAPNR